MAGHRHHILPRFLLKGFASRKNSNESFVWVYRKNTKPFEGNIVNVSVENHFYGRDGETNSDDEITKVEKPYAYLIDKLRDTTNNIESCDPQIAEFIAHLIIRTKNLRSGSLDFLETYSKRFVDHLSKPTNINKLIQLFKTHFLESLIKRMPHLSLEERNSIADHLVENALERLKNDKDGIAQMFVGMKEENEVFIKNDATKKAKELHNEFIQKNPVPDEKVEDYKKLNWFVCNIKESLILGDAGCLIETGGKIKFKTFDYGNDYVVNIFLPISTNKIVVGTRYSKPQPIKAKILNNAFALSAGEYFVSSRNSENEIALASKIGDWFGIVHESELEWIIQNMFRDLFEGI